MYNSRLMYSRLPLRMGRGSGDSVTWVIEGPFIKGLTRLHGCHIDTHVFGGRYELQMQ